MKICLYLEFYHFLGGIFLKNIGTGLLSSYRNQKVMLNNLKISFVEKWDDSCDILQINTPWLKSLYLIKKARRRGKKVIIWSHITVEDAMQVFRFMPLIAPLFKKYLIYVYNSADLIFSPTEYTKDLLINYGISKNKIVAQSNTVDLKNFYEDAKARLSGRNKYKLNGIVVGTVGLVIPRKGIDTFLMLAEKFVKNKFLWVGKMYSSILVKPLPKKYSSNAEFVGYTDSINEAFNAIDIFIFPSYEENQGMVILEAAAVGLPILVRDIPAYNGWLFHNVNCLKAKNEEEFEKYLKNLIEDESLRKRLGSEAKKMAQKESVEFLSLKRLLEYKKLLNKN